MRLLERMHQSIGTRKSPENLVRVSKLVAKGCGAGIQNYVVAIDGTDHGSWKVEEPAAGSTGPAKIVVNLPGAGPFGKPLKAPLENLPKLVGKLDVDGHQFLADSLRIAFLVPDEAAAAATGSSQANMPKAASVLEACSQAATVEGIREPWRGQVLQIPLRWPAGREPFEYQKIGAAFMVLAKMRAYMGDSPGLGKTAMAILAMAAAPKSAPALIVCPASVLDNWVDEIKMWAPQFHAQVCAVGPLPPVGPNSILIVSWARLPNVAWQVPRLRAPGTPPLGIRTLVLDEGHLAKNAKTKRARAARALAHRTPQVLVLSGTAIENRVLEMWNPLHMIDPRAFPDTDTLQAMASGHREVTLLGTDGKPVVRKFNGLTGPMLGGALRRWMVRRTKSQVLPQLPKKTRINVDIELPRSSMMAYKRVEDEIRAYLAKDHRDRKLAWASACYQSLVAAGQHPKVALIEAVVQASKRSFDTQNPLLKLTALRQLLGQMKVPHAVQWVLDRPGDPLVIFVEHKAVMEAIAKKLASVRQVVAVDGSVGHKKRHDIVQRFQAGQIDVLVCTRAMGIGVTLTRARRMLFVQRYWVPAWEEQAEDRIWRIGAKRPVEITFLHAKNTIDQHVEALVSGKRRLIEATLGGETVGEVEGEARPDSDMVRSLSDNLAAGVARRLLEGQEPLTPVDLQQWLKEHG